MRVNVRAGDPPEVAVPRLLDAYGGQIYALATRLCRKAEDAEDLVQEVFLRAFRKWGQFQGRADPRTWLWTIAARACQRMHRRRSGEPRTVLSLDARAEFQEPRIAQLEAPDSDGLSEELKAETIAAVQRGIVELPVRYRIPLVLKDVIGLRIADVARVLGLKEGTVKARVHRARLRVRRDLASQLPRRAAPPPAYAEQVCLDLLRAKQEALDRGVRFPDGEKVVCDRCRSLFTTLDLGADVCRQLAAGELPHKLREKLHARLGPPRTARRR